LWDISERRLVKDRRIIREQAARLAAYIDDFKELTQLLHKLIEYF